MPDRPPASEVVFVDDPTAVLDALASVDAPVVGVDVERADADRYFRRAALVQVGTAERCLLLDGVTVDAMPDLDAFLGPDRVAVLHAVENDLEPLARKGVHADNIADTAVAAALLGLPTGLSGLLAEVLGVQLSADKERFQRADWEARPIPADMIDYAAGDVFHLPALWTELAARLEAAGRTGWYHQELSFTIARSRSDTRDWTRVKGVGRLTPAARAVLRAVWEERERLAREHDIAPNRLVHDDVLRDLAERPPGDVDTLVRRSPRRRGLLREHAPDLLAAVTRGGDAPPEVTAADQARRWSPEDKNAYDALRKARAEVAAGLGLDAGVVCSSRPLWRAVARQPSDADELCVFADLRPWQTQLLREVLWEAYTRAAEGTSEGAGDEPVGADPELA